MDAGARASFVPTTVFECIPHTSAGTRLVNVSKYVTMAPVLADGGGSEITPEKEARASSQSDDVQIGLSSSVETVS